MCVGGVLHMCSYAMKHIRPSEDNFWVLVSGVELRSSGFGTRFYPLIHPAGSMVLALSGASYCGL